MKWNKTIKSPQPHHQIYVISPPETDSEEERFQANCDQMSVGIHLSPKSIDVSSATWPKMKRSDSSSGEMDVERIVRPQTATLERPRILDVALLGKIDMSLTRKGLLSISNLCIAPFDNVQAKRNPRDSRYGGKTRKWHTPRRSTDDKDRIKQLKSQGRGNGNRTDDSWDDDSVSDSSLRVRKVSRALAFGRSPSRGTPVRQVAKDKRVSPVNSVSNTNSPAKQTLKQPSREKRLSPVSSVNSSSSNSNSPSRCSVSKQASKEKRLSPVSSNPSTCPSPSRGSLKKRESPRSSKCPSPSGGPLKKRESPRDSTCPSPSGRSLKKRESPGGSASTSDDGAGRKTIRRPLIVKKDGKDVHEVFVGPKPSDEVPAPCRTCGRPEQPERFHSHPPPSSRKQRHQDDNNNEDPARVNKSSVRKPVPIKYRSGKSNRRKSDAAIPDSSKASSPDPLRRNSSAGAEREPQPVDRKSPRGGAGVFLILDDKGGDKPVARAGPRTVLCYLCGREFGTASYPLHEPHCLQRWERENNKLPTHLQRSVPEKPSSPLTVDQWNAFAWEASQAHLVPCENCGRTFNPDRLEVHQRSCRPPPGQVTKRSTQQEQDDAGGGAVKVPPAVYCYICGKMFGTRSIGIHEPQCLEKWRLENEKLPAPQRRPEPLKPQTPTGNMDFKATMDAIWQEHLQSLVSCGKGCGRTFNPDRVAVHERGCKGPKK
ncbi:uncharacterized protein [Periplaneta americana]|uniref:uncharacterized protein isoform X2 n=1 Tax=Periplaneta americana TaxID=6978 RepID=UPI0037E99E86